MVEPPQHRLYTLAMTVKLYYFNPNAYSQQWFVAAHSREEAIAAVQAHIRADIGARDYWDDEPREADDNRRPAMTAEQQRAGDLAEALSNLDDYINETARPYERVPACIEEHPIGHVIESEIS